MYNRDTKKKESARSKERRDAFRKCGANVMGGLDGIRVVELGQWVATPAAGTMLADWGAEVIHIEHPLRGDAYRGVLSLPVGLSSASSVNYTWELTNRNKKSLTVDVGTAQGQQIMHKLIAGSDVFTSNLRPYELAKFKLDYGTLSQINSRLIFANLTGYGPRGAEGNAPGYDYASFWARSGIMHMLSQPDSPPPACRPALGDHTTSISLALAIVLGLLIRERAGIAQAVDVSLFHTALWTMGMDVQAALMTGEGAQPLVRTKVKNPLVNHYRTRDERWIMITLVQPDPYWPQFCNAIEREDLEHDPRFNSFEARMQHGQELVALLDAIFATKNKDEWQERLAASGIIWSPIQTLSEVVRDPQAWANEYFMPLDHPTHGPINLVATPVKLSKTPATIRTKAPDLGEHTEELLLEMGYDWDEIVAFKDAGVIA